MRNGFFLFAFLFLSVFYMHCSLNLDDPQGNIHKAINTPYPGTWFTLVGEWIGDSTFTIKDSQAQKLIRQNIVQLEFYRDGKALVFDSSHLVFSQNAKCKAVLHGDTLALTLSETDTKTFILKFTFLGNYLEIFDVKNVRYTYFHKFIRPVTSQWDSLLTHKIWEEKIYRSAGDTLFSESFNSHFTTFTIHADSLIWENNIHGLSDFQKGPWQLHGDTLVRTPQNFILEFIRPDSLRLWPLHNQKIDSGFYVFKVTPTIQKNYLALNPILTYWRMDSLVRGREIFYGHYGQFFDLKFYANHTLALITNMEKLLPNYQSWDADSGFIWMKIQDSLIPSSKLINLKQEKYTLTDSTLSLSMAAQPGYNQSLTLYFSKADSNNIVKDPLTRFSNAPFVQLYIDADTLPYYFSPVRHTDTLDHYELAQYSHDTTWLVANIKSGQDNFNSSQTGFKLAFNSVDAQGNKFLYYSLPTNDLAIRLTTSPQPAILNGLIQGFINKHWSDQSHPDSLIALTGIFRFNKKKSSELNSPLWKP